MIIDFGERLPKLSLLNDSTLEYSPSDLFPKEGHFNSRILFLTDYSRLRVDDYSFSVLISILIGVGLNLAVPVNFVSSFTFY